MKFSDILALCEKEGIELSVKDGALRVVSTRNRVSDEIREILKSNKLLLISMLGGGGDASYREEEIVADPRHLETPQVVSFAQRRIWLESTLSEDKAIYNTRLAGTIRGPLDVAALEAALRIVIDRHAVLRTVYIDDDGEPLQRVLQHYDFALFRHECASLDEAGRETFMRALVDREMLHDFDLARDLPIRAHIVQHSEGHHDLVLTIHHIATDGWSTGLLMRELDAAYGACIRGGAHGLPDLPIQYVDYAVWQRARLSGASLERLLDYWRDRLDGIQTLHDLPLDFERKSVQSHQGRHLDQRIEPALARGLERLSSSLGVTMFVALQSMFALLMSRCSGSRDVVMGSANANRIEGAVQPLLGCFLNNLVLRTDLSQQDLTVSEFLRRQQRAFIGDFEHQHVPFELLVEQINPERSLAFHPLVQIMFGYENNDYSGASAAALPFERHELEYEVSKFDLSLHALPVEDGIEISWGYSLDLFRPETIARMANSFETLLSAVVADPQRPLHALPLVDEDERAALVALSEGPAPERAAVLLPALFRANAQQRGDAVAVQLEDEALDHAELESRSNRIARALVAAGVQVGDRVGVCQERTLDMVASVIGTMKAGAVYVPLDPGYPDERLAYLLSDAGISHVLTEAWLAPQLPLSGQRVVLV
ncbi:condensation domain-containing protein, partial [Lysobacter brunescens]